MSKVDTKPENTETQSNPTPPEPKPEAVKQFADIPDSYGGETPKPKPEPKPAPEATGGDKEGDAGSQNKLTPKDFKNIRKSKKEEREETQQKAQQFDDAQARLKEQEERTRQIEQERDQLQKQSTEWEEKQKQLLAETEQLKLRQEEADKRYVEAYGARYAPGQDDQYVKSSDSYFKALSDTLPSKIQMEDGSSRRVFLQQLREDKKTMQLMDMSVKAYIDAQDRMDPQGMDKAVQQFAQSMGMQVSDDLDTVERAIQAAAPHARALIARGQEIEQRGPELAMERWNQKVKTASDMSRSIFMSDEEITKVLNDPEPATESYNTAILNLVLNEVPEAKADIERQIARYAKAMALDGAYEAPPLTSKDPSEIAAHSKEFNELLGLRGKMAQHVARSVAMDYFLPVLFQKYVDLQERVGTIAENTNPEGSGQSGSQDPDQSTRSTAFDSISSDYNAHK